MFVPVIFTARSDEIPTLDVRPVCQGIASQSGDPGDAGLQTTFEQCVQSEQDVREQLKKVWSSFSTADKQHCVTLAKTGGESSNTELLTCLETRPALGDIQLPSGNFPKPPRAKRCFRVGGGALSYRCLASQPKRKSAHVMDNSDTRRSVHRPRDQRLSAG